jgi:hypothetical protein
MILHWVVFILIVSGAGRSGRDATRTETQSVEPTPVVGQIVILDDAESVVGRRRREN